MILLDDWSQKLQFPQIVLIVGSSGTGKTIMALECMRAKIGKLNLQFEGTKAQKEIGSNYKVIAIIWIDVEEEEKSQLQLFLDLWNRYLPHIQSIGRKVQPMTLLEAVNGRV